MYMFGKIAEIISIMENLVDVNNNCELLWFDLIFFSFF